MGALQNILHAEIIEKLGWTLLHFVWQAAAIGLLLAIVLRLMRKFTANLRYMAACVAMAALVVLPAITIQMVEVDAPIEITPPANRHTVDLPQSAIETAAIRQIAGIELPQTQAAAAIDEAPLTDRFIDAIEPALPFAVIVWLAGVFGLSIWHLGGWAQLQKLRRQMVRQVEPSLKANLRRLSDAMGISKAVDLMESALVQVPAVIGHFKPVILLPVSALTGLSTEQIEAVLAHELAHIKRNDYLVNMLQTVVEILGFYHPAVWWVSRKIRVERENCCDDMAVGVSGDKVGYVRTLALLEEIRAAQPGLAVAASGASLFDRIKRLLGKDASDDEKANWLPSVVAVLLIAALLIPTALALNGDKLQDTENSKTQQLQQLVEDFFKHNYRDITARKTIEWGEPEVDAQGNMSIRYKYEATIWDKDKIIENKVWTFDKLGKFVSVKNISVAQTLQQSGIRGYEVNRKVSDFPDEEDMSTPETAYAAINRVMGSLGEQSWQKVSTKKVVDRLQTTQRMATTPEWSNIVLNAAILEVRINNNKAAVIARFPQDI
ncbi:M56 family metallopeptidase, partial [Candidatus Oleimmundimicrobium sp.]|uniref:M56 family metallopeptidase n=1 Tax=Candidatus Oleimmundimicrobium sp. TaxID=3060597 RepID=UPI00272158C2